MFTRVLATAIISLLGSAVAIPRPEDFVHDAGIQMKLDYVPIEQGIEAIDISNATLGARENIFFQGRFWENKNFGGASKTWGMPNFATGYYVGDGWNDRISSLSQGYPSGTGALCCRWYNDYDGSKCYGSSLIVTGTGSISYVGDAQNDQISCGACWPWTGSC
ncbi:uncharacterized protein GGS22DRAFT_184155 [Annulohypoxylon maeteangense]|uniref:uncharacterized protein n=1 Tax=Annulohypoxylon maeteangense TaxID=1927788 RepID=UPI002007ED3D|nr:uncharacterized protein GGS22DRAFT_184155 [Annulohypoxylon maeteangense]KAI0888576.1 hypothetical protein GGS22DRAFT_184155 [Annulohypoxylon maeteangense]